MPKRPRQSHIPSQVRRRKPRRTQDFSSSMPSAADVEGGLDDSMAAPAATATAPRMGRRMAAVAGSRDAAISRSTAGQLPTFERAFLVRELTQIALVSGGLLALIVLLWVVMR